MDGPSTQLRSVLADLQLVSPAQWRKCRNVVRAFANDLPAFDSVWIDGLVQVGALTLFQAEWIARGMGTALAVGPYLLRERSGQDSKLSTYLAKHRPTGEGRLVTSLTLSRLEEEAEADRLRLVEFASQSKQIRGRNRLLHGLCTEVVFDSKTAWCAAPSLPGISAAALVVRRGRFPEAVVQAIAAQLIRILAAAEAEQFPHGDLRPAHLLVSPAGQISLINHGILNAIHPRITIHHSVPLDSLDGLSPERIRDAGPLTPQSEMYAAGCLLWQLLAGRPPHPSADPLVKRAAHVQRRVPDVREIAPETSPDFADVLRCMTDPDPDQRPSSFGDLANRFRIAAATSENRLARFYRTFESASLRPWIETGWFMVDAAPAMPRSRKWHTAAIVALAVAAGAVARPAMQRLLPDNTLSNNSRTDSFSSTNTKAELKTASTGEVIPATAESVSAGPSSLPILELPDPSAEGIVTLAGGRVYRARDVHVSGRLVIQAPLHQPAAILCNGQAVTLAGKSIELRGLELERRGTGQQIPMLHVQADQLIIDNCRIRSEFAIEQDTASLDWSVINPLDHQAGRLLVRQSAFLQSGTAIRLHHPLMGAQFEHVLKTGAGSLLELKSGVGQGPQFAVRLVMNHTTLRATGPLIQIPVDALAQSGQLVLAGENSAFSPAQSQPLILLTGDLLKPGWEPHFKVTAAGLVLHESNPLVAFLGTGVAQSERWTTPLDTSNMPAIDGLVVGQFQFTGPGLNDPDDCRVTAGEFLPQATGSNLGAQLTTLGPP